MSLLWLRDYFTDDEIKEYKTSFLSKYFSAEDVALARKRQRDLAKAHKIYDLIAKGISSGERQGKKLSRERKRQRSSAIKSGIKKKRQGNG